MKSEVRVCLRGGSCNVTAATPTLHPPTPSPLSASTPVSEPARKLVWQHQLSCHTTSVFVGSQLVEKCQTRADDTLNEMLRKKTLVPVTGGFLYSIKALFSPTVFPNCSVVGTMQKKNVMFLNPGIRSCLFRTLSHIAGFFLLGINMENIDSEVEVDSVCSASVKDLVHD